MFLKNHTIYNIFQETYLLEYCLRNAQLVIFLKQEMHLKFSTWLTFWFSPPKVKADVEVRKRIELIQDFEMPAISDRLKVSVLNAES